MKTSFKINGVAIKRPSTFKISRYVLTKSGRLANGKMTADIVAKKRKFFFTYDAIDAPDAEKILNLIWESDSFFFELEYVENNEVKTATVYAGEIPYDLHRTGDVWVWKNFNFNLIEQ